MTNLSKSIYSEKRIMAVTQKYTLRNIHSTKHTIYQTYTLPNDHHSYCGIVKPSSFQRPKAMRCEMFSRVWWMFGLFQGSVLVLTVIDRHINYGPTFYRNISWNRMYQIFNINAESALWINIQPGSIPMWFSQRGYLQPIPLWQTSSLSMWHPGTLTYCSVVHITIKMFALLWTKVHSQAARQLYPAWKVKVFFSMDSISLGPI